MNRIICALAFFSVTLPAFGQGVDPLIGTWKLNLEKSTFTGAVTAPKSRTATFTGEGQNLTATVEGVEAGGQALKLILRHIYDGQPHPTTGSPDNDSVAYYRIGNSISSIWFKNGKVVQLIQAQLVPGKTFTLTEEGITANGQSYRDIEVFDRNQQWTAFGERRFVGVVRSEGVATFADGSTGKTLGVGSYDIVVGSGGTVNGYGSLTFADGSELWSIYSGTLKWGDSKNRETGTAIVIGGKGRYAGATGSATWDGEATRGANAVGEIDNVVNIKK